MTKKRTYASIEEIDKHRESINNTIEKKDSDLLISDVSTLVYITKFAKQTFRGKILPSTTKKLTKPVERVHTLVLSDLHFGSDLKGDETGASDFCAVEEARRFASVIKEASLYKAQYRDATKLKMLILGDVIENQLHDARTGATIAEQCARAIHLLVQGVAYLATAYAVVEVECATGNHGRNTQRHAKRAIHQKFDSLETIIYYAVKEACCNLKNVKVNIPKTPMGSYEVFGKRIAYTHGDGTLTVGNPGDALNVKGLETQVNRINAALSDKDEYVAFVYGHTHVPHLVYLSNGIVLIGNGALPPPDHFAVSLGIFESNNGQWMFESTADFPVGDLRLLKVNRGVDADVSLDSIIKPWKYF